MVSARELITRRQPLVVPGVKLRQTLVPVSGRTETVVIVQGIHTHTRVATEPELSDRSDTTCEECFLQDDGFVGPLADIYLTYAMTPVTYRGPIAFLRFKFRAFVNIDFGSTIQVFHIGAAERQLAGPTNFQNGSLIIPQPYGVFTNLAVDWARRISAPVPWTDSYINANHLGMFLSIDQGIPPPIEFTQRESEFSVEVWG